VLRSGPYLFPPPRDAGEDQGGDLNDLNDLNDWNIWNGNEEDIDRAGIFKFAKLNHYRITM
jgi:hypothetical protein